MVELLYVVATVRIGLSMLVAGALSWPLIIIPGYNCRLRFFLKFIDIFGVLSIFISVYAAIKYNAIVCIIKQDFLLKKNYIGTVRLPHYR